MENEKVMTEKTAWKFEKECSGYGSNEVDNYIIPHELTVTITLNEYRNLLQKEAKSEAYEARMNNYKLRNEITELKSKIEVLEKALARCPKEEESEE